MADTDFAHMRNASTSEEVSVQYDGSITRWAPGETKRVPMQAASHFIRWGKDSAGQQALEMLDTEKGSIHLAMSEVASKQRDLAAAKELVAKASDNLAIAEKNLKIAKAQHDALLKTQSQDDTAKK